MVSNQNFSLWQPIYIGVPGLLLAIAGLRNRRFDERWLWLIILITALVLSFGANMLGYDIAYLIAPGYGQFRSQERHAAIATFALCNLAAFGLDGLLLPLRTRALVRLRRAGERLLGWAAVVAASVVFIRVYGTATNADLLALANRMSIVLIGLLGLGAALLLRASSRGRGQRRWGWGVLVLGLLVFDLFSITRYTSTQPIAPPFPESKLINAITDKSAGRLYNHYGLDFNMACINGLRDIGGGSPIVLKPYATFLRRTSEDVFSKLLNVRYTVTWRGGLGLDNGRSIPARKLADDKYQGDDVHLFELLWEPRDKVEAWLALRTRFAQNEDETYAILNANDFDPFMDVVVQAQDRARLPDMASSRASTQLGVEGSSTGYFKISTYSASPAVLVVSRAYHRNWVAVVNGAEVTPLQVDGALLGVPLPAGNNSIELSYRPSDLYIGAGISVITLITALAMLIVTKIRNFNSGGGRKNHPGRSERPG